MLVRTANKVGHGQTAHLGADQQLKWTEAMRQKGSHDATALMITPLNWTGIYQRFSVFMSC